MTNFEPLQKLIADLQKVQTELPALQRTLMTEGNTIDILPAERYLDCLILNLQSEMADLRHPGKPEPDITYPRILCPRCMYFGPPEDFEFDEGLISDN